MTTHLERSRPSPPLSTTTRDSGGELNAEKRFARAYCGVAHGLVWQLRHPDVPVRVVVADSERTTAYRLVIQPGNGQPARDSHGNYVYLYDRVSRPEAKSSLTPGSVEVIDVADQGGRRSEWDPDGPQLPQ